MNDLPFTDRPTRDALDWQDWASARAAARAECLREDMTLCAAAENDPGAISIVMQELKCSRQRFNTLARAYHEIGPDAIDTEVPDAVLNAVMEAAEATGRSARAILEDAIARGLHARQIRDEADIAKGRHVSRVPVAKGRHPYRRHGDELHITVPDMTGIEDGAGGVADVVVYPVLEKGE